MLCTPHNTEDRIRWIAALLPVILGMFALIDGKFAAFGRPAAQNPAMKAEAALGFITIGAGFLILAPDADGRPSRRDYLAACFGATVSAFALLTLFETVTGISLGIDEFSSRTRAHLAGPGAGDGDRPRLRRRSFGLACGG